MKNRQGKSLLFKTIDNPFCSMQKRIEALQGVLLEKDLQPIPNNSPLGKIDLHLHSNYSDGYWTPTGLLLEAYLLGMEYIALTDHDCFTGIEEGFAALNLIYQFTGKTISFVPGIEFSTNYIDSSNKIKEIHILGYFPSRNFDDFKTILNNIDIYTEAYLEAFQKCRVLRIHEMVKKFNMELPSLVGGALLDLSKINTPITAKTVKRGLRASVAPGRLLTSTGIYEVYNLFTSGKINEISDETFSKDYLEKLIEFMAPINSPHEFMEKYFGKIPPSAKIGYIGKTENPKWAVKTITTMGGIPVLAHPILYVDLLPELLEELSPIGLLGVEVISSNATQKDIYHIYEMEQFLKNNYPNLAITAGSDCHGNCVDRTFNYTPENPIGLSKNFIEFINRHKGQMIDLLTAGFEGMS